MKIEPGSVAVVTGAAGGIGLALAQEAARRGMRVMLSDVREEALAEAVSALAAEGAQVAGVRADVTCAGDVERLAEETVRRFGRINLLVNNAGTFVGGLAWETPPEQFAWVVDLNLKSVLHGIHAFVPRMIAQGDACHVLTIGSAASVTVYPGYASYAATKHGALALSEALRLDLEAEGIATVGVTVAMPGAVRTDILAPEKTSPAELDLASRTRRASRTVADIEAMMDASVAGGMAPEVMAAAVLDAVEQDRLYVLPNHDAAFHRDLILSIAQGRATGEDPFGPVLHFTKAAVARVAG